MWKLYVAVIVLLQQRWASTCNCFVGLALRSCSRGARISEVGLTLLTALLLPVSAAMADEVPSGPLSMSPLEPQPALPQGSENQSEYRGWDYLVKKLRAQGIAEEEIRNIYQDSRMPYWSEIPFKLKPRETAQMYSHFYKEAEVEIARVFLKRHKALFEHAYKSFKVGAEAVAAIIFIESHFGQTPGTELVVHRLSRMAAIAEPRNVLRNYETLKKSDARVVFDAVEARARYIEDLFFPEISALLEISKKHNIDILTLKGSRAGAFGLPQFLPSTFLKLGTDGDNDGTVSLFDEDDAVMSVANFLASFAWNDNMVFSDKKKILLKYNNSDAYVDAVLRVAAMLSKPPQSRLSRQKSLNQRSKSTH